MNIHTIYGFFMARFRPARIQALKQAFPQIDGTGSILDIGGTLGWWQLVQPKNGNITVINLDAEHEQTVKAAGYKFEIADARRLPFADSEFDLVFSNSVIEHVGGLEDQESFASEMLRCGRAVYLQTPYKWFPVEPHLIAPFLHWLPFALQRHMVRWFSVWGWVHKPSQQAIDEFIRGIRLMTYKEVAKLFPGCHISAEKFLGLTKSLIVTRSA